MSLRKILYTPSGRAGNYANGGYAANIFKGCFNKCGYCYVPDFLHMNAEETKTFRTVVTPAPDLIERITKDVTKLDKFTEPIFLCFTTDLYQNDFELQAITRQVIEIILNSGNSVNILTKGGTIAVKDFDLLVTNPNNKIGATLTFVEEKYSRAWEPGAALPLDRIEMLRIAHEAGIQTWVSAEPIIMPTESLRIMEFAMPYVDEFKIGKWNHDKTGMADTINWKQFALDAIALMEKNNKRYVLKDDLKKFLEV